jgi:hypothetical protein
MKDVALILSALISILCVIPYCRDIIKHKTKPNLVSWITWTLLTGVILAAQISEGEYRAAVFSFGLVIATGSIVVLGLWHGYVKYTVFDVACQMLAVLGLILWQVFDDPLIALYVSIAVDFIGLVPTLRHAWQKPFEETWQTFAIGILAPVFGFIALDTFTQINTTYLVYVFFADLALVSIILHRRRLVPA